MKKIIFLFFLIFLCFEVSGIGFSKIPTEGQSDVFEPNLEIVRKYFLSVDEDGLPVTLEVTVDGPQNLEEYIQINPEYITDRGAITLNISLPETIEGGMYTFIVCGVKLQEEGAGQIGIQTQVCTKFSMLATLPGKHLKINSFNAPSTDVESDSINLSFSVSNWGKERIDSVGGKFTAYDINGEFAAQVAIAERFSLGSAETESYIVPLVIKTLSPGEYTLRGNIEWDGEKNPVEDDFRIGSADFEILNITRYFLEDEVNDLSVTVRNDYGGGKEEVTLKVEVEDRTVTPPSFSMKAFEEKTIKTFLDTRGLEPGFYDAQVVIVTEGISDEEEFKFEIIEKPLPRWPFYLAGTVLVLGLALFLIWRMGKRNEEI